MNKKFTKLIAAVVLLVFMTPALVGWGQTTTKTEGFETATAGSTYNSTQNYNAQQSDCGIGWTMYYGTVSTNDKLIGDKSAQMRWYSSATSNLPYIRSTTPVDGLTKVGFRAKVGNTNVKMDVQYSTDGSSWTTIEGASAVSFTNNTDSEVFEYTVPSGGKYIQIAVSSSSTAPSSGNYKFIVDSVAFTYPTNIPSITAENVNINADATSGSISYQINNGTSGAMVSAEVLDGSTISNLAIDNDNITTTTVPFTCDANTEDTDKTATIRLTYNSTTTKDVTITQAAYVITVPGYEIDFENEASAYTDWTFNNMESQSTHTDVTAHGGSYFGNTGGKATASITTKTAIPTLSSLTCYVTRQSTNTTSSTWYIQVSSDGTTWTVVASTSATDMAKGEWKEFTADLSPYSNVYVRVYYDGSTAVRNIDDLVLNTDAPAIATTTTIDASGITNTDVYVSTAAGSLTATVTETESGNVVSGATVTWSGDNDAVATIDESTGTVTLVSAGTVTFTASYAGVTDEYQASYDTYEMTVTSSAPYVQPTEIEIVPNYTFWGKDSQFSGSTYDNLSGSKDNVSLAWSRGSGSTYANTTAMRFYKDNTLTFTAPTGYEIKSIVLVVSGTYDDLSFSPEGFSGTTWTGSASTVTMSRPSNASSYATISKFTITLGLPSSVATPTFNPVEGTYTTTQNVTISTTTDGATIYYTLDGTTPTSSSTEYSSPVSVSETKTIKAIAVLGSDESTMASATYTILPIEHAGTEADPYTVADARNAIDVYGTKDDAYVSGVISQVDSYNSTYHSITYWISDDGTTTNQLEVYSGKGIDGADFSSMSDIAVGATVVVKGNLKKYSSTYEFDYDNELVTYTPPTPPTTPSVTPSAFLIEALATSGLSGTLTVTYANIDDVAADVWFCNAAGNEAVTYSWIVASVNSENNVEYLIDENTGVARTAYFKVWAYDNDFNEVYSDLVTVTQAAPAVDYATLPFSYTDAKVLSDGLSNMPDGLTQDGLGIYTSSTPRLKFDSTNDSLVLKTNAAPAAINFDIKGNSFSGGTFTVQTSANGTTYTDLAVFTELAGSTKTITLLNTDTDVRYIKWVYTNRSTGNVALGNLHVTASLMDIDGDLCIFTDVTVAELTIPDGQPCTIYNGGTLNATLSLANSGNADNLIIKDGGQLKTPSAVYATVEKNITGYGEANVNTNKGYYLVSAPAAKYLYVASDNANVDAYHFDAFEQGAEWRNFKKADGAWHVSASSAVLFASKNDSTLSLDGYGIVYNTPNPGTNVVYNKVPATNADVNVDVVFNSGKTFEGFNLIGNPFTCTAYLKSSRDFYRMNSAGNAIELATDNAIDVCEGIFVETTSSETSVTFTTDPTTVTSVDPNNSMITLNLTQNRGTLVDNARIRFDNGSNMTKFMLNEASTKLYIPQGGKDYAVVRSEAQGEMPVNFKADKNGTYTLSIDIDADMDYLHLIDNMTGADVDLLQTPSYTFDARTSDYASRFRLMFSINNVPENEDSHSAFAYFNGSEWVINASDNATVQVVDVMGRVILNADAKHGVSTANMPAGVYILRLINGNDVKVQKIVVR